jgi:DNA-binding PucR family transcriptional regulator
MLNNKSNENKAAELLAALAAARSLQDIAEAGGRIFGNPIVITDNSWSVLAMSTGVDIPDDTAWNEFIQLGALSIDTVSLNIRNRLTERIGENDEPFIWRDPGMRYRRLLGKVFIGQRVMATVSVIEFGRPFDDGDEETVKLFCHAVSAEMQKNRYKKYSRGLIYEDFITGVLDGAVKSESLIRDRVRLFKLPLSGDLRLFVINPLGFDVQELSAGYLRDQIEKIMSLGMPIIYDGRILAVKSYTDSKDSFAEDKEKLESFVSRNGIRCGVSREGADVTRLPALYEEASAALRLGQRIRPGEYIYEYENYIVYRICEIGDETAKGDALLDAGLLRLIAYDNEHGTEFFGSLKGWFAAARNISDASERLHLHRNTLVYHLKRVEEIMGVSLTDPERLLALEVSLKTLEYRG